MFLEKETLHGFHSHTLLPRWEDIDAAGGLSTASVNLGSPNRASSMSLVVQVQRPPVWFRAMTS